MAAARNSTTRQAMHANLHKLMEQNLIFVYNYQHLSNHIEGPFPLTQLKVNFNIIAFGSVCNRSRVFPYPMNVELTHCGIACGSSESKCLCMIGQYHSLSNREYAGCKSLDPICNQTSLSNHFSEQIQDRAVTNLPTKILVTMHAVNRIIDFQFS